MAFLIYSENSRYVPVELRIVKIGNISTEKWLFDINQGLSLHVETICSLTCIKYAFARFFEVWKRVVCHHVGYESGMTMVEIAKRINVSERTIYRYKAHYDKITKAEH